MISFHVPAMRSRHCVRVISARVSDVPGVQTLEVDLDAKTVRVTGSAARMAVGAAITAAGYDATPCEDDVPPVNAGRAWRRRRRRSPPRTGTAPHSSTRRSRSGVCASAAVDPGKEPR